MKDSYLPRVPIFVELNEIAAKLTCVLGTHHLIRCRIKTICLHEKLNHFYN